MLLLLLCVGHFHHLHVHVLYVWLVTILKGGGGQPASKEGVSAPSPLNETLIAHWQISFLVFCACCKLLTWHCMAHVILPYYAFKCNVNSCDFSFRSGYY